MDDIDHKHFQTELANIYENILNNKNDIYQEESKTSDEVLNEGFLDVMRAKYDAHKEGKRSGDEHSTRSLTIDKKTGKGKLAPDDEHDRQRRMVGAACTTFSKTITRDLKRSNILESTDPNFEILINNFIRTIYILNKFDVNPFTGRRLTWTEVNRNIIDKMLRPVLEHIIENKENSHH